MIIGLAQYYGIIFLSIQMSGLLMSGVNGNGWMKENGEKGEIENNNLSHNSNSAQHRDLNYPRSFLEQRHHDRLRNVEDAQDSTRALKHIYWGFR